MINGRSIANSSVIVRAAGAGMLVGTVMVSSLAGTSVVVVVSGGAVVVVTATVLGTVVASTVVAGAEVGWLASAGSSLDAGSSLLPQAARSPSTAHAATAERVVRRERDGGAMRVTDTALMVLVLVDGVAGADDQMEPIGAQHHIGVGVVAAVAHGVGGSVHQHHVAIVDSREGGIAG